MFLRRRLISSSCSGSGSIVPRAVADVVRIDRQHGRDVGLGRSAHGEVAGTGDQRNSRQSLLSRLPIKHKHRDAFMSVGNPSALRESGSPASAEGQRAE